MRAWITSADGGERPAPVLDGDGPAGVRVEVDPTRARQTFLGVGTSVTPAVAAALAHTSPARRAAVLAATFGPDGAGYALGRIPIGSCDFATSSYCYAPTPDPTLADFSIDVDRHNGQLDLIRAAQAAHGGPVRWIASAWTAPPWMKDNGRFFDPAARRGGRLLPEHHATYAAYLARFVEAYAAEGVDVWAVTPVNEPEGNAGTWESLEMGPAEQAAFVAVLGRTFAERGLPTKILIFDQNRKGAMAYADAVFRDPAAAPFALGTAVHWYDSTFRVFEDELDRLHAAFPDRLIVHTEGCVDNLFGRGADRGPDAPTPWWRDDSWYWRPEAKDWGWDWLDDRADHPPYPAAVRYARDLVGGLAHHLSGWVDWNLALDRHGGPNHVGNYALAPILVDGDDVYLTPIHPLLRQFSRHTRPGAVVLDTIVAGDGAWAAAVRDPGGDLVLHLFNEAESTCHVRLGATSLRLRCPAASLATIRLGSLPAPS